MVVNALPVANPDITRFFHAWLETFAGYVRDVDYASAKPLFHPDVLAFGTHNDVIPGLDKWVLTQWDHVWPKTSDFRFNLEQTRVLASPDGSTAIVIPSALSAPRWAQPSMPNAPPDTTAQPRSARAAASSAQT